MCVLRVGIQYDARDEVRRRLQQLGAGDREHPWATLVLAHLTLDQQQGPQAIALYEAAAEGFAQAREAEGEVVARQNLATQYRLRGDTTLAAGHVARAVAAAEASKLPLTIARAAAVEAVHAMATGGDIGRAYRVLVRADRLTPPDAPIGLRRTVLFNLANANLYLGRLDEAVDALERHRVLAAEDGSTQNAATVAFNLLVARVARGENRPRPGQRPALIAEAEAVLAQAQELRDPLVEAQTHHALGDLLRSSDADRAVTHLRRCLDLEAALRFPSLRATCLWSLSKHELDRDPRRAEQWSREAVALARGGGDAVLLAYAWQARLPLVWRTLPEEGAIAQSFEALDAIERLRASQQGEGSRVELLSNWARLFQWLVGRLLQARPARAAQAFEVGERLRSRVLLEYLNQAGVRATTLSKDDIPGRRVVDRIAGTQRRLLDGSLRDDERRLLLDQLRLLELEEEELDAGRIPALSSGALPFASLDAVQRGLVKGEAMVWFSLAPWQDLFDDFGGGSWAVVVTADRTTIHPIRPDVDLDSQVAAFTGLLSDRGTMADTWAPAARRLGRTLFGDALAQLPPDVSRLVIVSDGPLHRVPFEALRPDEGAMLGERFDISVVPSATVWLRLREAAAPRGARGALVLANPDVPPARLDGAAPLGRLPWAQREARSIARLLDLDARDVLEGGAASERFLKQAPLGSFGVLHLAAHARADAAFPERSAVFLSPGDEREDGWLQPSEIAALNLEGRLVVLSACDSAEGSLLSGEGPLSLARAFFAGGASGVVATRWPLRDDDAAFLMERFYQALAAGKSVGAALRQARLDAVAEGLPAAAWAGVTSLGDGERRPVALRPGPAAWPWAVAALGLGVVLLGAVRYVRARRTGRTVTAILPPL